MGQRSPTFRATELFRDSVPSLREQTMEIGRETVQVVVWLVGLASALLVLAATNRALLSGLSQTGRSVATGLFVGVAVFGVLQRLVYHITEAKQRLLFHGLHAHLAGLTSDIEEPLALHDVWDRATIIKQLSRGFDLQYDFLDQYDVPIEKCREIYSEHYTKWQSFEAQKLNHFGELLAAFSGKAKGKGRELLGLDTGGGDYLERVRRKGMSVKRWTIASYVLFYACCMCFVAGLTIIGWALVSPSPTTG